MPILHGKQGNISFAGGDVAQVTAWSAAVTCDVAESTIMDDSAVAATTHWKEYKAGFLDWTATIESDFNSTGLDPDLSTDFAVDADGIAVILESTTAATGGRKYTGNGMVTGISVTADKNDIIKVTYTVQGSGALVEAAVV